MTCLLQTRLAYLSHQYKIWKTPTLFLVDCGRKLLGDPASGTWSNKLATAKLRHLTPKFISKERCSPKEIRLRGPSRCHPQRLALPQACQHLHLLAALLRPKRPPQSRPSMVPSFLWLRCRFTMSILADRLLFCSFLLVFGQKLRGSFYRG